MPAIDPAGCAADGCWDGRGEWGVMDSLKHEQEEKRGKRQTEGKIAELKVGDNRDEMGTKFGSKCRKARAEVQVRGG